MIKQHLTSGLVAALVTGSAIGVDHLTRPVPAPLKIEKATELSSWRDWPTLSTDDVQVIADRLKLYGVKPTIVEIVCADPSCEPIARSIAVAFDRQSQGVYEASPRGPMPPGLTIVGKPALARNVAAILYAIIGNRVPVTFMEDQRYRDGDLTIAFGLPRVKP